MTSSASPSPPQSFTSRLRRAAPWIAIALVALGLRLLVLSDARSGPFFAVLQGDAEAYDAWAKRIAGGDVVGSETFYQAPLYPYVLAAIYAATDGGDVAARYVQAFLGAIASVLLGLAAARWFDRRIGLAAALLFALNPTAIFFDVIIQKSSLEAFLTAGFFALVAAASAGGARRRLLWLASGSALGLLALARENALIWAPVALVAAAFAAHDAVTRGSARRQREFAVACCAFGLALPLGITAARNYKVGGEPQISTSQFGPNFYIGNHAGAKGIYEPLRPERAMTRFERVDAFELAEAEADVGRKLSAGEVSRYWAARSWAWIRAEPGEWLGLLARKFRLTWYAVEIGDTEDQYAYADDSPTLRVLDAVNHFGIIAPLAVIGLVATWPRRRALWVPYLLIVSYAATTTLFYVFSRYRFPLTMLLIPLAAAGLIALYELLRTADYRRLAQLIAVGLIAAVAVNLPCDDFRADKFAAVSYTNLAAALNERGDKAGATEARRIALERDPIALERMADELEDAIQRQGRKNP